MKKGLYPLLLGIGLAAALLANGGPARGALGETTDSVAAEQNILSPGRPSTEARNGYTVRQFQSDAVILREFISPEGVVFAIAWNGMIHPDLKQQLGSYYADYAAALERTSPEPGSRQLRVRANRVVVEKWGQMRNLHGRAYIPVLIPPGVKIDEIE